MLHGSLDGRGVWGRMDTHICMAESLRSSPETITTMLTGYTPIQNKKFKKNKNNKFFKKWQWRNHTASWNGRISNPQETFPESSAHCDNFSVFLSMNLSPVFHSHYLKPTSQKIWELPHPISFSTDPPQLPTSL